MTLRTSTRSVLLVAACMVPISACGQSGSSEPASSATGTSSAAPDSGQLALPADADPDTKKYYLSENATAVCMAKRGFTYIPNPGTDAAGAESGAVDGQDYALAKKYREKYGYGAYAPAVYPDDRAVPNNKVNNQPRTDPNAKYLGALTPAQRKAYDKALGSPDVALKAGAKSMVHHKGSCSEEARLKVYGPTKSRAEQEQENAQQEERARADAQALNGDPQLVSLAQEYASCLRDKGVQVTTTQPTGIGDMVKFQLYAQLPQDGSVRTMSRDEALPKLTHEIDLAVKDLECGKAFRAAYFPRFKEHPNGGGGQG
jgi:hypothetical protein